MNFLRDHWFDLAFAMAIILVIALYISQPSGLSLVMWLSLGALFLHQVEEWRFPGYFPGMLNVVMFGSAVPDRYPLNSQSGLVINIGIGWSSYLLAALFWQETFWLAIATMLVSVGNLFAHTVIFNIKGKTRYNPGLVTAWLCFAPVVTAFCTLVSTQYPGTTTDWVLGVALGMVLNYFGIYKMVLWMANRNTPYFFPQRCLIPQRR